MTYKPGTILKLREQIPPDEETGEESPYNRIKFISVSPAQPVDTEGWKGEEAKFGVYIPLSNFGANLHQPIGRIQKLYDIEFEPTDDAPDEDSKPRIKSKAEQEAELRAWEEAHAAKVQASRTPEEVFKTEAPSAPTEDGKRGRLTAFLDEVQAPKEESDNVLDKLDGGKRG
jgi:hypothetical protein